MIKKKPNNIPAPVLQLVWGSGHLLYRSCLRQRKQDSQINGQAPSQERKSSVTVCFRRLSASDAWWCSLTALLSFYLPLSATGKRNDGRRGDVNTTVTPSTRNEVWPVESAKARRNDMRISPNRREEPRREVPPPLSRSFEANVIT